MIYDIVHVGACVRNVSLAISTHTNIDLEFSNSAANIEKKNGEILLEDITAADRLTPLKKCGKFPTVVIY